MTLPSRSQSLRQPGYAHRDLIDRTRRITIAKHDEQTQERGASGDFPSRPAEDSQGRSGGTVTGNDSGSGQLGQGFSSSQRTNGPSIESRERRLNGRQRAVKGEEHVNINVTAAAGVIPVSSKVPLSRQLSGSSSIREPADLVGRRDEVRTTNPRTSSVDERPTTSSHLRQFATPSRSLPQEEVGANNQSRPLPLRVTAMMKPSVTHCRSRSSGILLEQGPRQHRSGGQDRLTSLERPQFSTYQQRFSPQKQKAPNEPSKLLPAGPYTNTEMNQFSTLQDELLQLQCIHISSHKTLQTWTEGGEGKIREQSKQHIQECSRLGRIEESQQDRLNAAAIRDWVSMSGGRHAFEKVEILSRCIDTLSDLAQPHSKVSRVIEEFDVWFQDTVDTLGERSDDSQQRSPQFILPLGQLWVATVTTLKLSLRTLLRNLQDLGSSDISSGLGLVLHSHTKFTKGLIDQLTTMEALHTMALEQEDDWVESRVSVYLEPSEKFESSACTTARSVAWHRVS